MYCLDHSANHSTNASTNQSMEQEKAHNNNMNKRMHTKCVNKKHPDSLEHICIRLTVLQCIFENTKANTI